MFARLQISTVIIFLHAPVAKAQYSTEVMEWPAIRLQLSEEILVDDLFEAGLRPFHRPYRERTSIHVKHVRLTVVDRDGTEFPEIAVDVMRISVQEPHLIQRAEIWTPPLTINEARTEMQKWLPMMDKGEGDLERFLAAVESDWLNFDTKVGTVETLEFGDHWNNEDRFQTSISFLKSWQWQAPLRMNLILSASLMESRRRNRSYYETPIPPPAGFEHVDMTAPENWDADNRFVPLTTEPRPPQGTLPPEYQALNESARVAESPILRAHPQHSERRASEEVSGLQLSENGSHRPNSWLAISLGVLGSAAVIVVCLRRRKGRKESCNSS